eukprot:Tamp_04084.p2 GENE.Tamp_04084~~Tamp_04084.p2  ORF type:complete len:240 (+),score=55.55 Tamp_04084:2427-3146(+)
MPAAAAAAALLLAASAHAFQVPAALRTRPGFVRRTALAAGFGPPKPDKPAKPAPAGKKRAKLAEPQWDPGWKAVQDAKERVKAKKAADEARRAAEDAVVGKQFQETVAQACAAVGAETLEALNANGYYVKDNFLGAEACAMMRAEAEVLYRSGAMSPGQSTRWNAETKEVETYDKTNVFTMQVQGGSDYIKSPRSVEYIVQITKVCEFFFNSNSSSSFSSSSSSSSNSQVVVIVAVHKS